PLNLENSLFNSNTHTPLLDAWHLKNNRQRVFRFIDVRRRYEYPDGNCRLFLFCEFPLLLDLKFLSGSHDRSPIFSADATNGSSYLTLMVRGLSLSALGKYKGRTTF